MKTKLLILLLLFSGLNLVLSQTQRCATDKMVQQEISINPDKQLILNQLELFTQQFIQDIESGRIIDTTYIIPVVVHVMHNYGDERISMQQVQHAIDRMNEDFNLINDDLVDANGHFISSTANSTDTVYIVSSFEGVVNWQVDNTSSVQKNDTISFINNGTSESIIIADDTGNVRFCGGQINLLYEDQSQINNNDTIAYIVTTEARGFEDVVADIGIEFRLATKDPDGNCTLGVTYNQSDFTFIGGENVKDEIYWDNSRYLNIWTVANVASGAAAYAYYPGSAPTNHEGILCQYNYFGDWNFQTGAPSYLNWQRHTMSHEAGHYFNLPHPWGSTNDPDLDENCGTDDGVEDTPNTIGASGCFSYASQVSCGTLDNVANIMDYTNCAYMFTYGQKQRMIAALNSSSGDRNNLWSQENLEITGTDDNHFLSDPHSECFPVADFQVVGDALGALGGSSGFIVSFQDLSYNITDNDVSYEWMFPGASPSSSNQKNPTVSYNSSGQHDVTLIVSNSNGNSELIRENYIVILDQTSAPFIEDFESNLFPLSESQEQPSWYVLNNYPTETNWQKSDYASYIGNQSIRIRSKTFSAGLNNISQDIYTPEIDCSDQEHTTDNPFRLYFNVAYAKRLPYLDEDENSIIADQLKVYKKQSTDTDFRLRGTFDVEDLVVNTNTYFNDYIPEADDWIEKYLNLGIAAGDPSLIIKFEFTGKGFLLVDTLINTNLGGEYISNNIGGNWLYIDNVRVGTLNDVSGRINYDNEKNKEDIRIFDLLGREYFSTLNLNRGVYIRNGRLIFIKE